MSEGAKINVDPIQFYFERAIYLSPASGRVFMSLMAVDV